MSIPDKAEGAMPSAATTKEEASIADPEQGDSSVNDEKPQQNPTPVPVVFSIPDGGGRAWTVVLGSSLVLFSTFGYVRQPAPHLLYVSLISDHR